MSTELQTTQVDLSGLLEVMGKNLYSSPSVAVRELVQNAHDACVRRRLEDPQNSQVACIRLRTDPARQRLIIEDSGAGLTKDEIIKHLATIGSGYTRLLRDQTQTEAMIGYFGLGFLSAYIVSDKVEMYTASYREPGRAWHFISKNGQRFSIAQAEQREVGAQVILDLSQEYAELADTGYLQHLLNKYCRLLQVPIYLNDAEQAINHEPPPWRLQQQLSPLRLKKLRQRFVAETDSQFESLAEIPIQPGEGCDVAGLIWVHDGSSYSSADNRSVTVFIRGMYISDQARELMPGWSGFCSCVLESAHLIPTASREDLQKNDMYFRIQEHVYNTLVQGLIDIAQNESETWQRILSRHNEAMLGAAISDDQLFLAIHQHLKLPTSEGEFTLPELAARKHRLLVSMEENGGYEEILCRAQKIPVIYGYRYAALSFTRKYTDFKAQTVHLLGTRQASDSLFKPAQVGARQQQLLEALFATQREKLLIVEFEPDFIPMLLIADEDALLKQRVESDEAKKRISTSALGLAKLYTQQLQDDTLAYLYLNLSSPLIQLLFEQSVAQQRQMAKLIRSFMIIVGHNENLKTAGSVAEELQHYNQTLLDVFARV